MTAAAKSPHRPGQGLAHLRFFGRYLRYNLAAFADSRLTLGEKILCLPVLLRHIARAIK